MSAMLGCVQPLSCHSTVCRLASRARMLSFLPANQASILGLSAERSSTLPLFSAASASSRARFSASCSRGGRGAQRVGVVRVRVGVGV